MAELSVHFGIPHHRWMHIDLSTTETNLQIAAHQDYHSDSLNELIRSLRNALLSKAFGSAVWFISHSEPEFCRFEFRTNKAITSFQVNEPLSFDNVNTRFELEMPSFDLVLAFWRGLRCLQAQCLDKEFEEAWGYPFPDAELEKLTEQIKALKKSRS